MVAIKELYMNKIPDNCKECPLTYLDIEAGVYFEIERGCVIDDSCTDGVISERLQNCPLIKVYTVQEVIAMLENMKKSMEIIKEAEYQVYGKEHWRFVGKCQDVVQRKIDV